MKYSRREILTVFVLLIMVDTVQNFSLVQDPVKKRGKRSLIYPYGSSFMQMVVGVGLPFEIGKQSITTGPFMKSYYLFPQNASQYTNPSSDIDQEPVPEEAFASDEDEDRKKREATRTRWSLYSTLSAAAEFLGYGGKACVLRAICETAEVPFSQKGGIIAEMLHVIFTPSSTEEPTNNYLDSEYFSAEKLGKTVQHCKSIYPECKINLMDDFTDILSHVQDIREE